MPKLSKAQMRLKALNADPVHQAKLAAAREKYQAEQRRLKEVKEASFDADVEAAEELLGGFVPTVGVPAPAKAKGGKRPGVGRRLGDGKLEEILGRIENTEDLNVHDIFGKLLPRAAGVIEEALQRGDATAVRAATEVFDRLGLVPSMGKGKQRKIVITYEDYQEENEDSDGTAQ